jgi:hypothetical protein
VRSQDKSTEQIRVILYAKEASLHTLTLKRGICVGGPAEAAAPGNLSPSADPVANGVDTSVLEHVSPIEWDNAVPCGPAYPRSEARPPASAFHGGLPLAGDPSPSEADLRLTRRIIEASRILQLQLIDHVIIGSPAPGRSDYFSFKEGGVIS